jgi:hypothetical protein
MSIEGTVQNGVVVFSSGQTLPEGTPVFVLPQEPKPQEDEQGSPRTIWEELAAIGREVESLPCDLPDDLAINHDHYLYGVPKRQ